MLLNLQKIENWLQRLAPPKWPEEVLGQIDRKKALEGKALFVDTCAGCHNSWPYTWTEPNKYGKRFVRGWAGSTNILWAPILGSSRTCDRMRLPLS